MMTSTLSTQVVFTFLDNLQEAIVYYTPVWSNGVQNKPPGDFTVAFCNKEAALLTGVTKNELLGQHTKTMVGTDKNLRSLLFRQILQVYETGVAVEEAYFNPVLEKHFTI